MLYITGFYNVTKFESIKKFSYVSGITIRVDRNTLSEFNIPIATLLHNECKLIYDELVLSDTKLDILELKQVFKYGSMSGMVIFNEV